MKLAARVSVTCKSVDEIREIEFSPERKTSFTKVTFADAIYWTTWADQVRQKALY